MFNLELHLETPEKALGRVMADHACAVRFGHDLGSILYGIGHTVDAINLIANTEKLQDSSEASALEGYAEILSATHSGLFDLLTTFEFANEIKYGNYDEFYREFLVSEKSKKGDTHASNNQ